MNDKPTALTATIVFESCAVNRDENVAGNIQAVKKLRRHDGVYTFISRNSIRHHLFNALKQKHGWKEATVVVGKSREKKVIQFDIRKEGIHKSQELDFFGYMYTDEPFPVTRKAPVGLTKAVSLEKWEGDMAFYANHDLVQRAKMSYGEEAQPNPFSKEEHLSLYKYSVVVDLCRVGKDVAIIPEDAIPEDKNGKELEFFGFSLRKANGEIHIEDKNDEYEKVGEIRIDSIQNKYYKVELILEPKERAKRVCEFMDVVLNGFQISSSTESWPLEPVFAVVAFTKIPITIFNPYVNLSSTGKIDLSFINHVQGNSNIVDFKVFAPSNFVDWNNLCKDTQNIIIEDYGKLMKWVKEEICEIYNVSENDLQCERKHDPSDTLSDGEMYR